MSIDVNEARELVAKCINALDGSIEQQDVNHLCTIINQMCEYVEQSKHTELIRLTKEEQVIIEDLVNVWNLFIELPQLHQSDRIEFMQGVHLLQNIILARVYLRYGKS